MDVAATAEQRLGVPDEARDGRRSHLPTPRWNADVETARLTDFEERPVAVGVGGPKHQAARSTVTFYLRLGSRGGLDLKWAASTRSSLPSKALSISASGLSRKVTAMVIGSTRYSVCPS